MTKATPLDLTGSPVLAIAWRTSSDVEVGRLDISVDVAGHFSNVARQHAAVIAASRRRQYTPEVDIDRKEEFASVERARFAVNDPLLSLLATAAELDSVRPADLPTKSLLLYSIVFPRRAMFVRKANPHLSARRGHVFTRLGNALTRIEEPIFDFDSIVDLVVTPSELWISNVTAFEYLFKDDDFLARNIPIWVEAIGSAVPLAAGSAELLVEKGLSNVRRRRRLESIADRGHLPTVTLTQLKREIARLNLGTDRLLADGHLVINDDTIDDVLKLLNEDLFIGGLSGAEFEVDRKAAR